MKVFDTVNNVELEADTKKLVDIMVDGRQVDVYLKEKKSDDCLLYTSDAADE